VALERELAARNAKRHKEDEGNLYRRNESREGICRAKDRGRLIKGTALDYCFRRFRPCCRATRFNRLFRSASADLKFGTTTAAMGLALNALK